jgi:hypothetical protein
MKYRLVFKSAGALDVQICSITQDELKEMSNNIDDAEELFYHAQGYDADIYNAIGVPADNYKIIVFKLDDFDAEIGDPIIISTGDLQLVNEKINANPGDIIIGSVTNGKGVCGHVDIELNDFDISSIKLVATDLSDFGSDSLCSGIAVSLDNGEIHNYNFQYSLHLDLIPKVELSWVSIIGNDQKEKTLYDEYGEFDGWDEEAVKAVLAKGVIL